MTKNTICKIILLCAMLSACGQKGPLIVDPPADATLSEQARVQPDTEITSETGLGGINAQVEGTITIIQR